MANTSSLNLVGLDFEAYKTNLKSYLRADPQFQDIDFEGSNINMLLDILAYNTYHNAFYLNMIGSEMFLDTAILRDSVYSHVKELNYVPRSSRSAYATIDMEIKPTSFVESITADRGTSFTTKIGSNTYIFSLPQSIIFSRKIDPANTQLFIHYANGVQIYEGLYVTDTFVMDSSTPNQRFIMSNPNVDTTSIIVNVLEDGSTQFSQYTLSSSFFNVTATDKVFFVQAAENGQYEILFGNDITGKKPKNGAVISCEYRVSSGSLPNGAETFRLDGAIGGFTNVSIDVVGNAAYGSNVETIDSIKFNAPRYFQTQERAVTAGDYKALMRAEFPEIDSIHVFGGEEATPPQYGKVIVAVDTFNAEGLSSLDKQRYTKYLKEKTPLTIDPVFVNPEFLYCAITSDVKYNINTSSAAPGDIAAGVRDAINQFCQENINDFDVTLRFSKLLTTIDNTYGSIISNETEIKLIKYLVPTLDQIASRLPIQTSINFGNPITSVESDIFTYFFQNTRYQNVYLKDNGEGILNIIINNKPSPVGTVNYSTGEIEIDGIVIIEYRGEGISFVAVPDRQEIAVTKNEILQVRESDITVNINGVYL
jgi:hypothetical protein